MPITFEQLRQRKLVQWSVAYAAGAWALLQLIDFLVGSFDWPTAVARVATVVFAAGFVATLVLAWYHGEQGRQKASALEIALIAGILVAAAFSAAFVSKPSNSATPTKEVVAEAGTIAVLPFVNRSADPGHEYFSDGITEEILSTLARIPELQVRARSSSFAFKGKELPMQEIARQLRVAHILEGSVQRAGERVRITAQLLDARTDRHLWSESFDRELKDIFAVEDEISRAIADALRIRLVPTSSNAASRTSNPEAHELYLRGQFLLRGKASENSIQQSIPYFEQAVALDPNYAAAHAGLAEAHLWSTPFKPIEQMVKARTSAATALELDERLATPHAVLGAIRLWVDWDIAGAERAFLRALELDPNAGNVRDYYAWLLIVRGDREGALRMAQEAVRLEPYSATLSYALEFRYTQMRDYDAAIRQHAVTARLDPDQFYWDLPLAIAYREKGEYDKAVAEYRKVAARIGNRPLHGLAITYARMGRTEEARRMLTDLEAREARGERVPFVQLAMIHANLGDNDRAMYWLERAYNLRQGDWMIGWIDVDPSYDPLRTDPRFQKLLARIPRS
ncbi:MAG: TPR end-of-group domain-containing protein [Gemmatimonadota bacterium]